MASVLLGRRSGGRERSVQRPGGGELRTGMAGRWEGLEVGGAGSCRARSAAKLGLHVPVPQPTRFRRVLFAAIGASRSSPLSSVETQLPRLAPCLAEQLLCVSL